MPPINALVLAVAGYLWGSISPSFVIVRWRKGIDLRHVGTGTVSGSGVGSQLGRPWMVLIAMLDGMKGIIPPALAVALGYDWVSVVVLSLSILVGHNWSLYLALHGGRGLSTTLGIALVWDARLCVYLAITFVLGLFTRAAGFPPIAGILMLAPLAWLLGDRPEVVAGSAALALIVVLKRLEGNRLPLPAGGWAKAMVFWRRLWLDRDVPLDQPWEERERIREG